MQNESQTGLFPLFAFTTQDLAALRLYPIVMLTFFCEIGLTSA